MGTLKHKETKLARETLRKANITGGRIYTQESVGGLAGNGMNCLLHGLYFKNAGSCLTALNANAPKGYHFKHLKSWNKVFHSFIMVKNTKPKTKRKT